MEVTIKDGTGDNYGAKVDKNHRVHALAVSDTLNGVSSSEGNTYNINTGLITLTSTNQSAIAYLKSSLDENIRITTIGFAFGASTGGSGHILAEVIRNPSAGTIVSGASAVPIFINKNFGNNNTISSDLIVYKGAEGNTLTDGTDGYLSLIPSAGSTYSIATGDIILQKGSSLGINITPPAGNTSMVVVVFFAAVVDKISMNA